MAHVEFEVETRLSPDRVVAALTHFSERRPQLWPNLDPELYETYSVGPVSADVKEGSRLGPFKIWAKEHYEWSPGKVTWTMQESNFCRPGSSMSLVALPDGRGGSQLHVVWDRTPSTLLGRVITTLVKATGGKPLARDLQRALDRQLPRTPDLVPRQSREAPVH